MIVDSAQHVPLSRPITLDWLRRGCVDPLRVWPSQAVSLNDNECVLPGRHLTSENYEWLPDAVLPVELHRVERALVTWRGDIIRDGAPLNVGNALPGYVHAITERRIRDREISFQDQDEFGEAFVLLHTTFQTYGHFLLEMAPKLIVYAALKRIVGNLPIILLPETPRFVYDWIRLLVPAPEYVTLRRDSVALIKRTYVSDSLLTHYVGGTGFEVFIDACLKAASEEMRQQSPTNIYISRNGHRAIFKDFRALKNSEEVEIALRGVGFEVIEPETYSIERQIAIFSGANVVVGEMCSALHNTIFSKSQTLVIQMNPFNRVQRTISLCRRQELISLIPDDGLTRGFDISPEVNSGFTVDPKRVLDALRKGRAARVRCQGAVADPQH